MIHADLLEFRLVLTGLSSKPAAPSSSSYGAHLRSCSPPPNTPATPLVLAFTASNNELQIRTCADSLLALQVIAMYLSNDGDLVATRERTPSAPTLASPFDTISTNSDLSRGNPLFDQSPYTAENLPESPALSDIEVGGGVYLLSTLHLMIIIIII